jgi:23S rRNA (adenine2030-N6)-methyltransferase
VLFCPVSTLDLHPCKSAPEKPLNGNRTSARLYLTTLPVVIAMNYRHAYHAGNFADVVKHLALVALLTYLKKKDKAFRVIDTHAGRGLYDLAGDEAVRTGEAAHGIARLRALVPHDGYPDALKTYLDVAQSAGEGRYPGSPLVAARLLRPQDRLIAIEMHKEEFAVLSATLSPFRNAKTEQADGYARLAALLPPPERRGLVLIDPPYEAVDEFARAGVAIAGALRRFATGIYLIWFPIKSTSEADRFCGEIVAAGAVRALRIDTEIDTRTGEKERLARAGIVVVNPPFGFADEMTAAFSLIASPLAARTELSWLAGES